uniref:Uncharacterized protein n=1 Tax=viral metagenome TaxID=1070528 RepID=A0A6M3JZ19_9ZZZZ
MQNAQPRLWIESTWLPVEVLEEIPPKKKRFSGELIVKVEESPEDGGAVWSRYGGKRLRLPAYMVYNYQAKNKDVKPNRAPVNALGGYGALRGGKAIERPKFQTDRIVDMDDPTSAASSTAPVMYEGAGSEVRKSAVAVNEASGQIDEIVVE